MFRSHPSLLLQLFVISILSVSTHVSAEGTEDKKVIKDYSYKIRDKVIAEFDSSEFSGKDLISQIFIHINTEGQIQDLKIVKSSDDELFDKRLQEAVEKAAPLPVPEDKMIAAKLEQMVLTMHTTVIQQQQSKQISEKNNTGIEFKAVESKQIAQVTVDYEALVLSLIQDQLDTYGIDNPFLSTEIELQLSRFGEIKDLQIQHSSNDPWFDKRVLAAVNRAAPFFAAPLSSSDYKKVRHLELSIKNLKMPETPVEQSVN